MIGLRAFYSVLERLLVAILVRRLAGHMVTGARAATQNSLTARPTATAEAQALTPLLETPLGRAHSRFIGSRKLGRLVLPEKV